MIRRHFSSRVRDLYLFEKEDINCRVIICLQKNNIGPALGGCRFRAYSSVREAIVDAIRLSRAMRDKAIISGLAHDGGKAVIMQSPQLIEPSLLFRYFSECVDSLNGRYITTIDSGTTQRDMAMIKQHTSFVVGDSETSDPSFSTALGVFKSIQVAMGSVNLSGIHVAIQGVGNVGLILARLLYQAGARLTVSDVDTERAAQCAQRYNAIVVNPSMIYRVSCDVFSPCALGRLFDRQSIAHLDTKLIAGAANDQLVFARSADELDRRGILYLPDFLINAGGLIHLSRERDGWSQEAIHQDVLRIGDRVRELLLEAQAQQKTLLHIVKERIQMALDLS